MSQENVEIVRRSFEFWRDGRFGAWIETLDRDLPTVWTVRDGRSARLRVFRTRAEALEAVGPSE